MVFQIELGAEGELQEAVGIREDGCRDSHGDSPFSGVARDSCSGDHVTRQTVSDRFHFSAHDQ